jgi:hypothetical protein
MRAVRSTRDNDATSDTEFVQIELRIRRSEPISGSLRTHDEDEHEFTGILHLIALLDEARLAGTNVLKGWLRPRSRRGGVAAVTGQEERLTELEIELPGLQPAMGNYLAAKTIDNLVFVSGHGPIKVDSGGRVPGKISHDITVPDDLGAVITGKVGSDISVEEAREAARLTGLFLLAALSAEVRVT